MNDKKYTPQPLLLKEGYFSDQTYNNQEMMTK